MVNNQEFSERLSLIMKHYDLTASSFSERIGVQRSSISHLLSGRNKPSLDFVLKVLKEFPEVSLYWFLNGVGTFPATKQKENNQNPSSIPSEPQKSPEGIIAETPTKHLVSQDDALELADAKDIERIVIFFKDGTFKTYSP